MKTYKYNKTITEEINPREVPAGCPELPKPYLAFIPKTMLKGLVFEAGEIWAAFDNWKDEQWDRIDGSGSVAEYEHLHYAIDVRTDFANKYFPQIVEAMDYKERDPIKEVEDWYWTTHGAFLSDALKKAYELGQRNPEA